MFQKHRKRRVIYNDDSAPQYQGHPELFGYHITDEKSILAARTTLTFGTHVDAYVWCLRNGCDPP